MTYNKGKSSWSTVLSKQVGKNPDQKKCEDVIYKGTYYAVIDGATDKSGYPYRLNGEQVSSGKFAALIIASALDTVPLGTPVVLAVETISKELNKAILTQYPNIKKEERPSASIIVFDSILDVVWSVGDCLLALEGNRILEQYDYGFEVDKLSSHMRFLVHQELASQGKPWNPESEEKDPGREAILPFLKIQGLLSNTTGDFTYGVMNGLPIPLEHIKTIKVSKEITNIYLASDGYPSIVIDGKVSYEKAEEYLQELLLEDPLCIGRLRGTKGLVKGNLAHDDRSWLHIARI